MRKMFTLLLAAMLISAFASPVWAGGDKVRGEKGQGETRQVDADSQGNQAP